MELGPMKVNSLWPPQQELSGAWIIICPPMNEMWLRCAIQLNGNNDSVLHRMVELELIAL